MNNQQIINDVNQIRDSQNLEPLHHDKALDAVALLKANDMCNEDYWAHNSSKNTWESFFDKANYKYEKAGENLAYGFTDHGELIAAWVKSPEHYANIVGKYTHIGSAVIVCKKYQGYSNETIVVNEFSVPMSPTGTVSSPQNQRTSQGQLGIENTLLVPLVVLGCVVAFVLGTVLFKLFGKK